MDLVLGAFRNRLWAESRRRPVWGISLPFLRESSLVHRRLAIWWLLDVCLLRDADLRRGLLGLGGGKRNRTVPPSELGRTGIAGTYYSATPMTGTSPIDLAHF